MSDTEHPAPLSHRGYVWSGFGLGLMAGVFGLMHESFASLELLNLVGGAAGGAVVGSVLFRTRHWRRDDYTAQVLRIWLALLMAILVLSDLALLTSLQSFQYSRLVLAIAPGGALGFGWAVWARHFNERGLRPAARDLGVLCAVGTFAIVWAVLLMRFAPMGAV